MKISMKASSKTSSPSDVSEPAGEIFSAGLRLKGRDRAGMDPKPPTAGSTFPRMSRSVQNMFDAIAGRYDCLNGFLSAGRDSRWRQKAAALLLRDLPRGGANARMLDLCGGTGDFTRALRAAGFSGFIVNADFSRPMLRTSADKGVQAAAVLSDALHPPFGDGYFDAVVCGFGMRNLDALAAGIGIVQRLLRPGGVFVTLEFFRPATPFTRFFYRRAAPVFMPLAGRLFGSQRAAYTYLSQSVLKFSSVEEYAALCRAQGFAEVHALSLDFGIAHAVRAVKGEAHG